MAEEHALPDTAFEIRKVYLKDSSLESPNAPQVFLSDPGQPNITVDASIKTQDLAQDHYYEVILRLTITALIGDKTAFLVEVMQAGVFQIIGLEDEDMPLALHIACPNVLLPFAREAVADLVGKAGFPQLLISPINFEALYQQKLAHEEKLKAEENKTQIDPS